LVAMACCRWEIWTAWARSTAGLKSQIWLASKSLRFLPPPLIFSAFFRSFTLFFTSFDEVRLRYPSSHVMEHSSAPSFSSLPFCCKTVFTASVDRSANPPAPAHLLPFSTFVFQRSTTFPFVSFLETQPLPTFIEEKNARIQQYEVNNRPYSSLLRCCCASAAEGHWSLCSSYRSCHDDPRGGPCTVGDLRRSGEGTRSFDHQCSSSNVNGLLQTDAVFRVQERRLQELGVWLRLHQAAGWFM